MATIITLTVPDDIFSPLARTAEESGQPVEEWILARIRLSLARPPLSGEERDIAMARLMRHAGSVHLGYPTDANNERIDADLAREYANAHETA